MLQQTLAHSAPVLTDGVSGQEVPHSISDGCQPLQALDVDQKAANTTADILLTAEDRGHGQALVNYSILLGLGGITVSSAI